MKNSYNVQSERYGHTHKFISAKDNGNPYIFTPAESWMPLYVTYNKDGTIFAIDTEGGPFITCGWTNGEITVEKIEGELFYLKENKDE